MKADVFNSQGEKIKSIELPGYFSLNYREDIINKVYEALKFNARQPYSPYALAGKDRSSGKVRHVRKRYRTAYGRGISRVPRKIMLRRKPQGFYWQGSFIPSAKGGFRAHPPKLNLRERKVNKKEKFLALLYALSAIANKQIVFSRYKRLEDRKLNVNLPFIVDIKLDKVKETKSSLAKIFSPIIDIAFKEKKIRAGKGKLRGRRYKSSAGLLLIVSSQEFKPYKTLSIDIVNSKNLSVKDLALGNMPGRLTAFTPEGLKELEARIKQQAEKLNIDLDALQ